MATKLVVPETAAELQEMMDDPKTAAQIIANGQWSEFTRAYAEKTDSRGEMRDMIVTALKDGLGGMDGLEAKVTATTKSTLDAVLKEYGVNRPPVSAPDPSNGAKLAASKNPMAPGAAMDEVGFANIGDYARVVFQKGRTGDDRYTKAVEVMNAYSSNDAASAGFLIPETFRSDVYELALEQSIVRPRASVITLTGGAMVMPYVDQTTHVGSVFGGMVFYWTEESGSATPTEAKFGRTRYQATKLVGFARIPNELWADAPALSSWLMNALPRGIAFYEDVAFISGNGVGQPLGVQNSPAVITITKETGQAANTINVENILKMYAQCLPQSLTSAVWLANPTCFPELMKLSIAVGTGGAPVNLVNVTASPTMTLLGRPLILTEKVPALSSAGDIGLYDFSFYTIGDRQSASLESSEHSRFANDETELRSILRVDGRPWIQSSLTPVNGNALSPFVILGAR